jgi:ABC-type Fe3+-hydroxamate transport system substrate-binding protein
MVIGRSCRWNRLPDAHCLAATLYLDYSASLDRLDILCACTKYCVAALPELAARNLPVLHDSWTASAEEIRAAEPDLVIASVPYRMESLAAILKAELPVLALTPHGLDDVYEDIRLVEAAGGDFIGVPGGHMTPEEIAAADPDVLLFAWCGAGDRVPLERVVAQRAGRICGLCGTARSTAFPMSF